MAEETFAQRIERLIQDRNLPALLAETQQLLTIYLNGDGDLDLEPIVSALAILLRVAELDPSQDLWNKEFVVTSVTRADLVSARLSQEQVALLSDAEMQAIASRMEDLYRDGGFWDDVSAAERKADQRERPMFPPLEL